MKIKQKLRKWLGQDDYLEWDDYKRLIDNRTHFRFMGDCVIKSVRNTYEKMGNYVRKE